MLQDIRDRSTGWISKALIGLIAVLLSFTGFEAIMSSSSNANNAAKVNGQEITQSELAQAKSMQAARLAQQFGNNFDVNMFDDKLMTEMALNGLINRSLLLQGAQSNGFVASEAAIDAFLLEAPEFQENGQFSAMRFDQVLSQMGYGRLQFRGMLAQDMLLEQLQLGMTASAFVTEQEALQFARLEAQTRDFASLVVEPQLDQLQVTDEEIDAYYQANTTAFMTQEQVQIEYIELKRDQVARDIAVSEEELENSYQQAIGNLGEHRRASHILFEVAAGEDEQSVLEKALQALARLEQGESFASLASELSDDLGSASQGGDLGFAGTGVYEPAFEDALFALQDGQVSRPVATEFGYHLIKLTGIQAADVPDFAQMRESLLEELQLTKTEQHFVELVQDLENIAYESADLEQPAHELGLQVQQSVAFGRDGGEGLLANRGVIDAAFSPLVLENGANSEPVELDRDTVVVLRVKEHLRPSLIALEQVADNIRDLLIMDKAREQSREQGEVLLARLQAGEAAEALSGWQQVEAAGRMHEEVQPQVLQQVFRMPEPAEGAASFAGLSLADGSYILLRLTGVSTPEDVFADGELEMYRQAMASRQGQADFAAYTEQLQQAAKIERF